MKFDEKGVEVAASEFFDRAVTVRWYGNPSQSEFKINSEKAIEATIQAYLTATNSVIVPREPTDTILTANAASHNRARLEGHYHADAHTVYTAMIKAAQEET